MSITLGNLDLSPLLAPEAHLGVAITIADKSYNTGVTFFDPKGKGRHTTLPNDDTAQHAGPPWSAS